MSELPLDSSNVEEAYLASVIVDPEQLDITMHSLNPQYFSVKIHQDLFKAMVVLREAGRPI
ncbi:hypothetical protein CMI37_14980 [Candidatus Pacearchaeota archaeon]|nr:hypothetical protein [Candidatus Pacearchaeota archaeon]